MLFDGEAILNSYSIFSNSLQGCWSNQAGNVHYSEYSIEHYIMFLKVPNRQYCYKLEPDCSRMFYELASIRFLERNLCHLTSPSITRATIHVALVTN